MYDLIPAAALAALAIEHGVALVHGSRLRTLSRAQQGESAGLIDRSGIELATCGFLRRLLGVSYMIEASHLGGDPLAALLGGGEKTGAPPECDCQVSCRRLLPGDLL